MSGRLIDRVIRPLFNHRLRRDVQVIVTILSYDEENDPDFIALLSASTALAISNIPWNGPAVGVRLARTKDNQTIINPLNSLFTCLANGAGDSNISFDAFVAGTKERINMIELGANEAKEQEIVESFDIAHKEIGRLIDFQKEIIDKIGQQKTEIALMEPSQEFKDKIISF